MVFKKIIFQNRYVALETPSRPHPLHGKCHLKFPFWFFDYLPYFFSEKVNLCVKMSTMYKEWHFSLHFFLRITIFNIRRPRPTYLWPRQKHFASAEASQKMGYECKILLDLTSGQEVILARRTRPSKMEVSPWCLGFIKVHRKLPFKITFGSY